MGLDGADAARLRTTSRRTGYDGTVPKVCPNPDCPDTHDRSRPGGEYRDDVDVCPRCGHVLEWTQSSLSAAQRGEPSSADEDGDVELVELCVAADPVEATLIEGLLQAAGIRYLMTDPVDTGFGGWGRIIVGPGSFVGRARFVVSADDLDEARALLAPSGNGVDGTG